MGNIEMSGDNPLKVYELDDTARKLVATAQDAFASIAIEAKRCLWMYDKLESAEQGRAYDGIHAAITSIKRKITLAEAALEAAHAHVFCMQQEKEIDNAELIDYVDAMTLKEAKERIAQWEKKNGSKPDQDAHPEASGKKPMKKKKISRRRKKNR